MSLEWSSNSVHELISKLHFFKYLKHKLPLNLIKSLFCFKRQSNNQPSCSFSQVSVLNQHKKHQEPKGGFLIKSSLMRLQAGGSNLSPEKYESTPQICKQTQERGSNSSNQYFFKPHVHPLPRPPAPPPLKICHWGFSFSSFPSLNNMLLKPVRGQSKAGGGTMAVRASGQGPLSPPLPVSQQGEKGVHIGGLLLERTVFLQGAA